MSAQKTYGFSTAIGSAGGIVDLAPYAIDTFLNEEANGKMKFGVGVVKGTNAGTEIKLPAGGAQAADFEGVTTNNRTTEYDLEGKVSLRKGASVGVMRYGRVFVRLAASAQPKYGEALHMQTDGDDAGCFSNSGGVEVAGRFLSGADNGVAMAELFNAPQPASGE